MKQYQLVIVENDEDEQLFMREGFAASGKFEILAIVEDGHALLTWLNNNPANYPDLILSDLNMPGKNGYDIIRDIKNHPVYSLIPVIITSTSSTRVIIDKCKDLGADEYVVKPESFIDYTSYAHRVYELIREKNW